MPVMGGLRRQDAPPLGELRAAWPAEGDFDSSARTPSVALRAPPPKRGEDLDAVSGGLQP